MWGYVITVNLIMIFIALWIMWKNNQDKIFVRYTDYEPIDTFVMTTITSDFISVLLAINILSFMWWIIWG